MKLLITGSTGFLGRYTVQEALQKGHAVRAVVRPSTDVSNFVWADEPNVEIVRADLRSQANLVEAVTGVDAVLHLAAAKAGDIYAQLGGTVVATENLLNAMQQTDVRRLVIISSFSVYEYLHRPGRGVIDEYSPLDADPEKRDEYCQTKLLQEQLARRFADQHQGKLTVLRPSVIFGPDNAWTALLGAKSANTIIRTGAHARLPLTYVENCAQTIILAAETDAAIGKTLNVIDDEMPTQKQYLGMLKKRMTNKPRIIPVAWTIMRTIARCATITNRLIFKGAAKVPGIFIPERLHARCKPMRYNNNKIKETLNWSPRYNLQQSLDRTFADVK